MPAGHKEVRKCTRQDSQAGNEEAEGERDHLIQLAEQVTLRPEPREAQRDTDRQETEADGETPVRWVGPRYSRGAQSRRRARRTRTTVKRLGHLGHGVVAQPRPLSPHCHFSSSPPSNHPHWPGHRHIGLDTFNGRMLRTRGPFPDGGSSRGGCHLDA